jgi:hypothetical protein
VHAYSLVNVDDANLAPDPRRGRRVPDVSRESPEATAVRIHADRIDVLVDLAGYTTFSRPSIFALRPAPVQAALARPPRHARGGLPALPPRRRPV